VFPWPLGPTELSLVRGKKNVGPPGVENTTDNVYYLTLYGCTRKFKINCYNETMCSTECTTCHSSVPFSDWFYNKYLEQLLKAETKEVGANSFPCTSSKKNTLRPYFVRQGTPNTMHTSQFIENERIQYKLCVLHHGSNRCRQTLQHDVLHYSYSPQFFLPTSIVILYSKSILRRGRVGITPDSYSGVYEFISRPGNRLSCGFSWFYSVPPEMQG
jgi:hypothetical protein